MSQLSCQDLTIGYDGKKIIEGLSFTVNKGDYLCIVGENGSGKSTLIKTLLGILKPISGNIIFNDGLKKNEIGYLTQQLQSQKDFPSSVYEIVLSGCVCNHILNPFYNKKDKEQAILSMHKMGIEKLSNHSYNLLSGGQQQRVLLARALCATKKMLLLDEPVTGLDPYATNKMYELMEKLNKEDEITIIMVSHDLNGALKYASHILYLGNNLFFGKKETYLNRNKNVFDNK